MLSGEGRKYARRINQYEGMLDLIDWIVDDKLPQKSEINFNEAKTS